MKPESIVIDRAALEAAIEAAISDEAMESLKKKARSVFDDVMSEIEWSVKECLASSISYHAADMADRAIQALLSGNSAFRQLTPRATSLSSARPTSTALSDSCTS